MTTKSTEPSAALPASALVVGIVLILVSQFLMESLADSNDAWHWLQHGTICLGGIIVGAASALLYVRGQRIV